MGIPFKQMVALAQKSARPFSYNLSLNMKNSQKWILKIDLKINWWSDFKFKTTGLFILTSSNKKEYKIDRLTGVGFYHLLWLVAAALGFSTKPIFSSRAGFMRWGRTRPGRILWKTNQHNLEHIAIKANPRREKVLYFIPYIVLRRYCGSLSSTCCRRSTDIRCNAEDKPKIPFSPDNVEPLKCGRWSRLSNFK